MIQYSRPEFLWALPLLAIPVIIHLINRLRYRRIRFAATRFLLESQQRYKVRVLLREWFLLVLRVFVVGVLILLFARPQLRSDQWGSELLGRAVHLILVLDDSLSMQARDPLGGTESTFDRAKQALSSLLRQIAAGGASLRISLLRLSQVGPGQLRADLAGEAITPESISRVEGLVRSFSPTFSAVPAPQGLEAALEMAEVTSGEGTEIVLFSDFQQRDWELSPQLATIRDRLLERGARLTLIWCRENGGPRNLAVMGLEGSDGICVEGVPVKLRLGVANYSDRPVRDLPVVIYCENQVLPPVIFSEILPWQTAFQDCFVVPGQAGQLRLSAEIGGDILEADNRRFVVLSAAKAIRVLLADGDPQGVDAQYVEAALAPGGVVQTGFVCRRVWAGALSAEDFNLWDLVILVNPGRVEPPVLAQLERFVAAGGGLGYFVGEKVEPASFQEQFFRGGEGLFPVTLGPPKDRPAPLLVGEGNLRFEDPPGLPGLKVLSGPVVSSVFVTRHMPLEMKTLAGEKTPAEIFLRLSDGMPLGVVFSFGSGKTAIIATTAGPRWNNWARVSPSYVVTLLELAGYLARKPVGFPPVTIGQSLKLAFPGGEMPPMVRYRLPGIELQSELTYEQFQDGSIEFPPVTIPGFGEVEWELKPGEKTIQIFAGNVDCRESDLRTSSPEQLRQIFAGVPAEVISATNLAGYSVRVETADLVPPGLLVLLGAVVLERLVSFLIARSLSDRRTGFSGEAGRGMRLRTSLVESTTG
jgi:hypothetical protein